MQDGRDVATCQAYPEGLSEGCRRFVDRIVESKVTTVTTKTYQPGVLPSVPIAFYQVS